MIRVLDPEKPYLENPVCIGSVGFGMREKNMKVLNLFNQNAQDYGLTFYPSSGNYGYYVDPCNPTLDISLNDYFSYLKRVRIDELTRIAQDLGATKIRISLKAEKKTFVDNKAKIKGREGKVASEEISHTNVAQKFESIEVASESSFKGHDPVEPKLVYFKNENDIKSLIEMRMNKENLLTAKTISFKYNNSSGMKEADAINVDAALAKMKLGGNASISSEVRDENRLFFEYYIEFPEHKEG